MGKNIDENLCKINFFCIAKSHFFALIILIITGLLHIHDMLLKIYVFILFLKQVISFVTSKMVPGLRRAIEKTNEFKNNFLIIWRYLNFVKLFEDNL
jgi:hypothetical protein